MSKPYGIPWLGVNRITSLITSVIEKGKLSVRIGHKTIRALCVSQGSQLPIIETHLCLFYILGRIGFFFENPITLKGVMTGKAIYR